MWVSDWYPGNRHVRRRHRRDPQLPGRWAQPRRQRLPDEHRQHARRPAVSRLVVAVRPGQRVRRTCPATSCCSTIREDPPGGSRNWCTGFMPADVSGHDASATAKRRSCTSRRPTAYGTRGSGRKLDFIQELNRQHLADARTDDTDLEARIAAYELAYRMQSAAPEAVDLSNETAETQQPVRPRRQGNRRATAATACWPGGWSSAACASCSSTWAPAASGTPTATSKGTTPALPRDRPADRRVAQGPEAPRPAGQHAGDLGRRIRPHADERKRQRPRSQSLRLHDLDGRRRHQAAALTYGATDEIGLYAVENKAHVHDIHATILHLLGPGPRSADLPPQRPRRTADDYFRSGDRGDHGVGARSPGTPRLPDLPTCPIVALLFALAHCRRRR